ncbi:tetratricopeptide repeat protein [Candidatus Peregrinibacteria bacterium]|nr:tetratricopeptide repeat protein [Candidatus Peregrinibacteria bacterium]
MKLENLTFWHLAGLLAVITAVVFSPIVANGFVHLDDALLIYRNPAVQQISFWSLKEIFTTYDPELYVPLTLLTYQIEHALFGLNPVVYHSTNLLLHIGSSILLLWIFLTLTNNRFVAFLCSLLFAIHPLQTEAVAWAAARKDVLSGFLFFASIAAYVRYQKEEARRWYRKSIGLFALALLAKVSVIMLPLVLILLDVWQRRPLARRALIEKSPYFLLSLLFGVIAIMGKTRNLESTDPLTTVLLAAKSTLFYLWKLLIPMHLGAIYPEFGPVTLHNPQFLGIAIGLGVLLIIGLIAAWKSRTAAFGLGFFLLMLIPNYTNFFKNAFLFFASDRYVYLALPGLFFLIALAVDRLMNAQRRWIATLTASVTGIVLVFFAGLTATQARIWKDTVALYENTLADYPEATLVWNNLGDHYMQTGNFAKAEEAFERAVALDPALIVIRVNLGNAYREHGRIEEAMRNYQRAIDMAEQKEHPGPEELSGYYFLGEILDQMGRSAEGLAQFERAIAKGPDYAETYFNLGLQYQKKQDLPKAEEFFSKAVTVDPVYARAHYHLAATLAEQGKIDAAIESLERSLEIDPHQEKAREHLENLQKIRR